MRSLCYRDEDSWRLFDGFGTLQVKSQCTPVIEGVKSRLFRRSLWFWKNDRYMNASVKVKFGDDPGEKLRVKAKGYHVLLTYHKGRVCQEGSHFAQPPG